MDRKSAGNSIKEKCSIRNDRKLGTENIDSSIIVYVKQKKCHEFS